MFNENFIEKIKNADCMCLLSAKVITNAKKNSMEFLSENEIKLHITKIAVDNQANKEIIKYLSDIFDIPKSSISIFKGEKSNKKIIKILPKNK